MILTGMNSWSGEHKDHRHGLRGTRPKGNNLPFSRPTRYRGHRHGVWTHEVKRATGFVTELEEKEQDIENMTTTEHRLMAERHEEKAANQDAEIRHQQRLKGMSRRRVHLPYKGTAIQRLRKMDRRTTGLLRQRKSVKKITLVPRNGIVN